MNSKHPIPVDFGNCDDDGAVRLETRGTVNYLKAHGMALSNGQKITMSDGEIIANGTCTRRDDMWVAVIEKESDSELR
jgi:hypothetical protein